MPTVSFFLQKIFFFFSTAFVVLFAVFYSELNDHRLHLVFLNVGQGDAIYIKTPDNHKILIDGGPQNVILDQLNAVMPFLGRELDLIVLTHPHADHLEGLVELINRLRVKNILINGADYDDAAYYEFLKIIRGKNIKIFFAESDQDFFLGDTVLDILYPFEQITGQTFENINNSSIVMKISYKDFSVLLGGDAEKEVEMELLEEKINLNSDIFKASHHGSRTANNPDFINAIKPFFVVIQCGLNNDYGHPHLESILNFKRQNVRKIYRTDTDGRIEFVY